jgi:hypothetical protein
MQVCRDAPQVQQSAFDIKAGLFCAIVNIHSQPGAGMQTDSFQETVTGLFSWI